MSKFRVKFINGLGYMAQIKQGFLRPWRTIGQKASGYILCDEGSLEHPLASHEAAQMRIKSYGLWAKQLRAVPPHYTMLK